MNWNLARPSLGVILLSTGLSACLGGGTDIVTRVIDEHGEFNPPLNPSLKDLRTGESFEMMSTAISFDVAEDGTIFHVWTTHVNGGHMAYHIADDSFNLGDTLRMTPRDEEEAIRLSPSALPAGIKPASAVAVVPATSLPPPPPPPWANNDIDEGDGDGNFEQKFAAADIDPDASTETFRVYNTVTADGDPIRLTMLIPGDPVYDMSYVSMGIWEGDNINRNDIAVSTLVFGLTPISNVPLTGEATFNGFTLGRLISDDTLYTLSGDVRMTVAFVSDSFTSNFFNMQKQNTLTAETSAWTDFTFNGVLATTCRCRFAGSSPITSSGVGYEGSLRGAFYKSEVAGFDAAEVGGTWNLANDDEIAIGSFVGKQGGGQ